MSKTFTSMDALKIAIQKEIRDAMTEVADQSLLNVHQNVDSFYAFGGGGHKTKNTVREHLPDGIFI